MSDDLSGDMLAPSWPNLVLLVFQHVANFRYVANFRFLTQTLVFLLKWPVSFTHLILLSLTFAVCVFGVAFTEMTPRLQQLAAPKPVHGSYQGDR